MLTGDNIRTRQAIAGALGLKVKAGLLPEDKLREIGALKARAPVTMTGDGINDAPALAAASVGIAMAGGTEVALETADAVLLRGQVTDLPALVRLSRATMRNIHPVREPGRGEWPHRWTKGGGASEAARARSHAATNTPDIRRERKQPDGQCHAFS
jgi:magnesium-transporting ATPase (P-type)